MTTMDGLQVVLFSPETMTTWIFFNKSVYKDLEDFH